MAFFDDLGKKITQTGQGAVQKTKDFTETTRLNGQITDIQKKIDSCYQRIGKLYYEKHAEEPEEMFQQLIAEIQSSYRQIDELNAQIQQIKGTKSCPKCGSQIAKESAFCPVCGAKADAEENTATENAEEENK